MIDELARHVCESGEERFESRLGQHLLSLCVALQAGGLDSGHVLDLVWDVVKVKPQVRKGQPQTRKGQSVVFRIGKKNEKSCCKIHTWFQRYTRQIPKLV